jgi:hypothetical protein
LANAIALIESKESGWSNAKHRAQWRSTLEAYCRPVWDAHVDTVDVAAVLRCLQVAIEARDCEQSSRQD